MRGKQYFTKANVTQKELGEMLGKPHQTISWICRKYKIDHENKNPISDIEFVLQKRHEGFKHSEIRALMKRKIHKQKDWGDTEVFVPKKKDKPKKQMDTTMKVNGSPIEVVLRIVVTKE